MPSMQIVFLFDLNAYTDDHLKIGPDLNRKLLCLRLSCLKILQYYYTIEPNLKWGFKFFDSHGPFTQNMCKFSFSNVSLENFEILENEISVRYQRHQSYLDALTVSAHRHDASTSDENVCHTDGQKTFYPVQILQLALTQVLYEYQWSNQMTLFSPCKKSQIYKQTNKNDLLFLITRCPDKEKNFFEYFGTDYATVTNSKFSKALLSRSLHEQLLLKSSILWIWLNTCSENILSYSSSAILGKTAEMLKFLKCALVPVSAFPPPPSYLKFEESDSQIIKMDLLNSLLPFSAIFSQSITYPFYCNKSITHEDSILHFQENKMSVSLTKIPLQWNSSKMWLEGSNLHNYEEQVSHKKDKDLLLMWSKFSACSAIPKNLCLQACDTLLCFPSDSLEVSNYEQFQDFNGTLILKNMNLFLICESVCGVTKPGIFSPISDTSALISIVDPKELFKIRENASFEEITMKPLSKNTTVDFNDHEKSSIGFLAGEHCLKPFQMECMEHWFEPSASICELSSHQESQNKFPKLTAFYKKFAIKLSKNRKPSQEKENIAPNEETQEGCSSEVAETYDVSGLTYDGLIEMLTTTYDQALKPGGLILNSVRKIVKSGYSFFQQNSCGNRTLEDVFKGFLTEFFFVSNRQINEKYESSQQNDKRIQECQLQVLLALETETICPSTDKSNCVNTVISFLRTMSFYSGALELNKFLCDILRETYKDTLYDILVEIGEELDIPLFEEEDELPFEPSEPPSSESMLGSNNSMLSSTLSIKSSSSASSKPGSRKLVRKRSDLMDNSKSRQFLLTKSSPKKKKYKNLCPGAENIPVRYSPRLSSKRKKERNQKSQINPGHVRRNLFPKDQKMLTPKYSQSPRNKRRSRTPKAHHILKTCFVPETPVAKQNRSALERRKSFMDTDDSETSLTEIAESPKIVKNATDPAYKDILKRLSNLENKQFAQPECPSVPSCSSYSQYTPESKRRLSLKLFSKLLTSPTARMGLKKCSKRLFEQVSPHVERKVCKKRKLDLDSEKQEIPETLSQEEMHPNLSEMK